MAIFSRWSLKAEADQAEGPILERLNCKRIVLASGSPRRAELAKQLGLKVELCPSLFKEDLNPSNFRTFEAFVEETAHRKVLEVFSRLSEQGSAPDVVIGADTMVTLDGVMFGKPTTKKEAIDALTGLAGRTHIVYTAVVIKTKDDFMEKFCENTKVTFGKLRPDQIKGYVDTGEPMDKAGSYGIQGVGGSLVERIDGDYFTVVGLPLYRLCQYLTAMVDSEVI